LGLLHQFNQFSRSAWRITYRSDVLQMACPAATTQVVILQRVLQLWAAREIGKQPPGVAIDKQVSVHCLRGIRGSQLRVIRSYVAQAILAAL
jgi:hypothetical protein